MRTRLPPYLFTVVVCAFAAWSAACSPGEEGVTDAQATQDAQTSTTDTGVVDRGRR
ncbi:MAG: hypothetical protein H6730_34175 [Deltaproteobacteria bacterium]|nr:hypothetical protein [Deltaproteobacteria bacterium]